MRFSFVAAAVAATGASASVLPRGAGDAQPLPLNTFDAFAPNPLALDNILNPPENETKQVDEPDFRLTAAAPHCANPRVRVEWDNASNDQRMQFINAVKCLKGKPATGAFKQAKDRYEDYIALHQQLTPNVHTMNWNSPNHKFLLWHRLYMFSFEQSLRNDCGFQGPMLWFDETRYAGSFSKSSIFSSQYFGSLQTGSGCTTTGAFSQNIWKLNVGPGTGNTPNHCIQRSGVADDTQHTNSNEVNACMARTNYADMAACMEGGFHAYGHNGIGGVMRDVYASPGDPFFWLHHGFVDRNFRIWQGKAASRKETINGQDKDGKALTLDTTLNVYGWTADAKIKDLLDTENTRLCYKYNY